MKRKDLPLILGLLLSIFVVRWAIDYFSPRDVDLRTNRTSPMVYQAPSQKNFSEAPFTFKTGDVTLYPQAVFDVTGLAVGKRWYPPWGRYHFAPYDVGLAWGGMSAPEAQDHVSFWQVSRFLRYRYGPSSPLSNAQIDPFVANIHIIPANDDVKEKISRIRRGDLVRLSGFLVHAVDGEDFIKSSMTRHDTGAGACEILYVQDVDLDPEQV